MIILAAWSFWIFMMIVICFDLELKQYNAVNAFVHAFLSSKVYMWMSLEYHQQGKILQLNKTVYELQKSPMLWQRLFTETLIDIEFKSIPHKSCCLTHNGILIFFYVDDIVLMYWRFQQAETKELLSHLKDHHNIFREKDLQWFLEIAIYQNCINRHVWLSQASYIEKIVKLADKTVFSDEILMIKTEFLLYDQIATRWSIWVY